MLFFVSLRVWPSVRVFILFQQLSYDLLFVGYCKAEQQETTDQYQ